MEKKNVLLIVVLFMLFSANSVLAQNHTSAVGVMMPSGTTPSAPLHVYGNSSYVNSGAHMWSTYTLLSWLRNFPDLHVNKNLFVYSGGSSYPDDYVVHDGFQASSSTQYGPRVSSQTWWERVALAGTQRWGHSGNTYMTLNNNGLGVGTTTPRSPLHAYNSTELSPTQNQVRSLATFEGALSGNNTFYNSLWLRRDAAGSTWETVRLHDGIAASGSKFTATPGTNTSTWWERDPKDNIQQWGHESSTYMTLKGGNLGIGVSDPAARLHVHQGTALGTAKDSYQHISTFTARVDATGNSVRNNLFIVRRSADTGSAGYLTAYFHDGFSYDAWQGLVPSGSGKSSKCWWERDPMSGVQQWGHASTTYMTLKSGNLGIGVTNPTRKLEVNGTIRAKEVIVESTGSWADFVFDKDYKLPQLAEVEAHIKERGHLPEIPSAAEVAENGINLSEMNVKLLQKVEELTLYVIQLNKEIEVLKNSK